MKTENKKENYKTLRKVGKKAKKNKSRHHKQLPNDIKPRRQREIKPGISLAERIKHSPRDKPIH